MIKTILGILGLIAIGTMFLIIVCACIISGWISEREYEDETKHY